MNEFLQFVGGASCIGIGIYIMFRIWCFIGLVVETAELYEKLKSQVNSNDWYRDALQERLLRTEVKLEELLKKTS